MSIEMAAKKLSAKQKDTILQMLAERHTYAVISAKVGIARPTVAHYASEFKEEIAERKAAHDAATIDRGLRAAERRTALLEKLAIALSVDLGLEPAMLETSEAVDLAISTAKEETEPTPNNAPEIGLYYTDTKLAANGDKVTQLAFKAAQTSQLRGTLDDIAKETNGRVKRTDITTKDMPVKVFIGGDADELV